MIPWHKSIFDDISFFHNFPYIYSGQIVFGPWMIKTAALENYCRAFSFKAHKKGKILMEGTFSEFAKLAGRWFYLGKPKMCPLNTRRSPMGLSVHELKFLNQFWCQRMACGSRSDFTLLFHYAVDTLINSNTYQTLPIRIPLQTHRASTQAKCWTHWIWITVLSREPKLSTPAHLATAFLSSDSSRTFSSFYQ